MANFDWRSVQGTRWSQRFPENVRGAAAWRQQRFETSYDFRALVERVEKSRDEQTSKLATPCVFVSHKQADVGKASRIAYLACQEGFDYWLDVIDPGLAGVAGTPDHEAQAIAAIIEMGLLNSSHVLAVMTANTQASQWVPYEYGRVKSPAVVSPQAACWVASGLLKLPEYLHLGPILKSESEIRDWLKSEHRRHSGALSYRSCGWTSSIPSPL